MSVSAGTHCPTCGQSKAAIFTPSDLVQQAMAATQAQIDAVPWWHRVLAHLEPFEPLIVEIIQDWLKKLVTK